MYAKSLSAKTASRGTRIYDSTPSQKIRKGKRQLLGHVYNQEVLVDLDHDFDGIFVMYRRSTWMKICNVPTTNKSDVVSGQHFESEDYIKCGSRVLKWNAVPTVLTEVPNTTNTTEKTHSFTSDELRPRASSTPLPPVSNCTADGTMHMSDMAGRSGDTSAQPASSSNAFNEQCPMDSSTLPTGSNDVANGTRNVSDSTESSSSTTSSDHQIKELQHKLKAAIQRNDRLRKSTSKQFKRLRLFHSKKNAEIAARTHVKNRVPPLFFLLVLSQLRNAWKRPQGKRWTDDEKTLCISLYSKSPRFYNFLRSFVSLPSSETLQRFSSRLLFRVGLSPHVIAMLRKKVSGMKDSEKECVIVFDEIYLKRGLSYDAAMDVITGYVDHGELGRRSEPASHALVFMLQGIYTKWKMPVAYFYTGLGTPHSTLEALTNSVLKGVYLAGVNVRAIICDGTSPNKSMFKKMGATLEDPFIVRNGTRIYTMTDPPHLLKAVRNSLLTHYIVCNGQRVDWSHFKKFALLDMMNAARIAPKVTDIHLMESSNSIRFPKIRVNIAAQTPSSSVAAGLFTLARYDDLPAAAATTALFFLTFDKLFYSFNGTSKTVEGVKNYRTAITDTSHHLELWSKAVPWLQCLKFIRRSGSVPKKGKGKGTEDVQVEVEVKDLPFRASWIWAINATWMLWQDLRAEGYTYLPTRRLNREGLENLFSGIRYNGGNCKAPTPDQFQPALKASLINMLTTYITKKKETGNCEEDTDSFLLDMKALFTPAEGPDNASMNLEPPSTATVSLNKDLSSTSGTQQNSCLTPEDDDGINYYFTNFAAWDSKGASQIAGEAIRKVLAKTNQCRHCASALTAVDTAPEHDTLIYKDNREISLYTYPKKSLCIAVDMVMKIGASKLPQLFPHPGVMRAFHEQCASAVDLLDSLTRCPAHEQFGLAHIFQFLTHTAFYKEITVQNRMLKSKDTRYKMFIARDRDKYAREEDSCQDVYNTVSLMNGEGISEAMDNDDPPLLHIPAGVIGDFYSSFDSNEALLRHLEESLDDTPPHNETGRSFYNNAVSELNLTEEDL